MLLATDNLLGVASPSLQSAQYWPLINLEKELRHDRFFVVIVLYGPSPTSELQKQDRIERSFTQSRTFASEEIGDGLIRLLSTTAYYNLQFNPTILHTLHTSHLYYLFSSQCCDCKNTIPFLLKIL
jgi:hypothetical protein